MVKTAARLSREDWLDHGLKSLARSGPSALKAEPLAKALGVSRGSFYWHFSDLADFHHGVISRWKARTTDAVIAYVDQSEGPGRLELLMQRALSSDDRLERAIRSWSVQDMAIAQMVAAVDRARVGYLTKLIGAAGVAVDQATIRARCLYWASLGRLTVGEPSLQAMTDGEIEDLSELLQS